MNNTGSQSGNIFYEIHGTGEPLILIGGFAFGAWSWFCQTEDLAEDFQVITFDPRGIGRSNGDYKNLSLQIFAEDVAAVLDALNLEKASILGASFGGFVAQDFVLRFPERAGKLILACTTAGGAGHVNPKAEVLQSFLPNPSLTIGERIRKFMRPAFTEKFNLEHAGTVEKVCVLRETYEVADEVYFAQLQAALTFDTSGRLGEIENETLVLTGDRDNIVPMQNSINLAEKLPHSKLVIIENGSHLFFIENAAEFNQAVREFLK